jgi:Amt family ammonium transporter
VADNIVKPEFDESAANGGNPLEVDVNAQFAGFEFHAVYLAICAYLVWMIIPGLALLYGGLARRKSALAMLYQGFAVIGVSIEIVQDMVEQESDIF